MRKLGNTYPAMKIVRWLWKSSADNRLQAVLNTVIGLLDVAVSLGQVWAVKHAIDVACHTVEGDVIMAVVYIALLILCNFVLSISSVWVRNILGVRAQNRMQRTMLACILRSEWKGREAMHSGDVLNRLEADVSNVVNFVAETLPSAVSVFTLFLGAFVFLYTMDHMLALIIVGVFPMFLLMSRLYMKRMRQLSRDVRDSDSLVQSVLQESVQNRMLVKTLEGEDLMVERLDDQHRTLRHRVVRRTKFSVLSRLFVNVGFAFGYLVTFAWSALRLSAGTLTYGGMTAFLQLVNKIQTPARNLTKLAPQFVSVFTAAERLMMFEEVPQEEQGEPVELNGACGVRLDNVTYAYSDDMENPVIKDFSFDFKPGTCTAIVGETGVGKTTLLRMILALVKPTSGSIYIYNKEKEVLVTALTRCNMTYVPQGNTMLSGSVRDNLLLGCPEADDAQMMAALDMACAEFVRDLPDGLDTMMSENGNGLSEGQAQRICIARALLRRGSLLIFDEATSALDPQTEKRLLKNVLEGHSHTVVFITHRPAVLEYCDASLSMERVK